MIKNSTADQAGQRAAELFSQGMFCAESVLQAVAESRGITSEFIPKIASGLCGGISRTGGLCGAVSGSVLAIGLIHGRSAPTEPVDPIYELVQTFLREFEARFGSTNCERLIGLRLDTPEARQFFRDNLREKCQVFTGEAARMVSKVIEGGAEI